MVRKLLQGFMFGVGLSAALAIALWLAASRSFPTVATTPVRPIAADDTAASYEEQAAWRDMPFATKMESLSGAVLLRFRAEADGLRAAYVEKVVAGHAGAALPYAEGDRVEDQDYYAEQDPRTNRDGVILMYAGNPPKEMEAAFLYESRLTFYKDMPVEVFFKTLQKGQSQ